MFLGIHSSQQGWAAPPVGRTIPITLTEEGTTLIDGAALPYEGGTTNLQNGDTVVIQGGITNRLHFDNLTLPDGQSALVKNNGLVELEHSHLRVIGSLQNVHINFHNQDGVNEYGVLMAEGLWWQETARIHLDYANEGGWENASIGGIHLVMNDPEKALLFRGNGGVRQPYFNGTQGVPTTRNCHIHHIKLGINADLYQPMEIYGRLRAAGDDYNYHENLELSHWVFDFNGGGGCDQLLIADNLQNYNIHHFTFDGVNYGASVQHWRFMHISGCGNMHHMFAKNYYGNLAQLRNVRRIGSGVTTRLWNMLGYNNQNYALVELQRAADDIVPGITEVAPLRGDFMSMYQGGTLDLYTSNCVQRYDNTPTEVYNSVVARGYWENPEFNKGVADPQALGIANNKVYDTIAEADLEDLVTLRPNGTSPLVTESSMADGAGDALAWATHDIWGTPRGSTPAIGAVEAD